jgi:hypothetical protein
MQGGPSYASVTAQQIPDPDIAALKEQLAELKTTIQAQQQQLHQPSALPAQNPPAMSLPPELSNDNSGTDGNNAPTTATTNSKSLSRNSRVTKPTSATFHTISCSKESLSKYTDLRVASL